MNEIVMLNASQLAAGCRQCRLLPVAGMCAVLDRVTKLDPIVDAFCGAQVDAAMHADVLYARHALTASMETFFQQYDLLLTPTFHCGPPPVPGLPVHLHQMPVLTAWCNQAGLSTISVPCGSAGALPVGLQIIDPWGIDELVLLAAPAYDFARGDLPVPAGKLQLSGDREIAP